MERQRLPQLVARAPEHLAAKPRRARSSAARTKADLPMPGSPSISTTLPRPAATPVTSPASTASSRSRPSSASAAQDRRSPRGPRHPRPAQPSMARADPVARSGRPCCLPAARSAWAARSSLPHSPCGSGWYRVSDPTLPWRYATIAVRYRSFFRPVGTALRFNQPLIVESLIEIGGCCSRPRRTSRLRVGWQAAWYRARSSAQKRSAVRAMLTVPPGRSFRNGKCPEIPNVRDHQPTSHPAGPVKAPGIPWTCDKETRPDGCLLSRGATGRTSS